MFIFRKVFGSCVHKFVLHLEDVYIFNCNLYQGVIAHNYWEYLKFSLQFVPSKKVNRDFNSDNSELLYVVVIS